MDSAGLLLAVVITAASVQDRDAARPLLQNLHRTSRRIRLIWAGGVYAGKLSTWAAAMKMSLQIVARRNPHAFEGCPAGHRPWDVSLRGQVYTAIVSKTVQILQTLKTVQIVCAGQTVLAIMSVCRQTVRRSSRAGV